ncbi:MAG: hypothetical protein O7A63_08825 [Acidobacteria bacterium]|nr:hypothetical protein [Acidobacteriota bacterium]
MAIAEPDASAAREEFIPALTPEIESVFRAGASVDAKKMKMQVPIVCLQTLEEQGAIAALRRLAADMQREFMTWSVSRGLVKESGKGMGDMYRDPNRMLEFIRRHKENGLYLLADFRQCLEDRTVARALREMVMEGETSRALLVLTAPRLLVPPELQSACVTFNWPESDGVDFVAIYEEVLVEVAASAGRPVRLEDPIRTALLTRVKDMPVGRARFEIAKELMARTRTG